MALARHKRTTSDDVPHIPFYKDERVIGKKITVSVSLRLLIGALIVFVLTIGWALFALIEAQSALNGYVHRAHSARMADQRRTDKEIDQLACYLVATTPDDPKMPIIKKFRDSYHCPPYGQDPNLPLYGKGKHKAPSPSPSPTYGSQSVQPSAGGGAATVNKKSHSNTGSGNYVVAGPTSTPTPSSPSTTTAPAPMVILPIPVPSVASASPVGVGGTCAIRVQSVCLVK